MKNRLIILCLAQAVVSASLQAQDPDFFYAVYNQNFSETRITDGQALATTLKAKYLTLVETDGLTSNRAFRTWQLNGKKNYTLLDDTSVLATCSVLDQGTKKVLVSYWDSLPTGRHFNWSTGKLKGFTLAGRSVLLPPTVLTKGVGVPKDSDPNLKEYAATGVLDFPATQAVNNANPLTDEDAENALKSYYQSKGFNFD